MALITFVSLVVLMVLVALASIYGERPIIELKRASRAGDNRAHFIHEVARHGRTALLLLRIPALIIYACTAVLFANNLSFVSAVGLIIVTSFLVFAVHLRYFKFFRGMAVKIAPYYAKILVKVRPYTNGIAQAISRFKPSTQSTDIYEMEDLIALLEHQKTVHNNRIEKAEIDMAINTLKFGDKKVADHMVPRSVVRFVRAEEPVGPILLAELHDSGFSRFPVRKEDEEIVGTLYLKDLVEKRVSGIVSNVMSPDVFYVHADEPLNRVLAKFLSTKHHLFIVRNEFSEVVGIITIEDVIEQIVGQRIVDESDVYEDMRDHATSLGDELEQ